MLYFAFISKLLNIALLLNCFTFSNFSKCNSIINSQEKIRMAIVSVKVQLKTVKITLFSLNKNKFNTGYQILTQLLKGLKKQALGWACGNYSQKSVAIEDKYIVHPMEQGSFYVYFCIINTLILTKHFYLVTYSTSHN